MDARRSDGTDEPLLHGDVLGGHGTSLPSIVSVVSTEPTSLLDTSSQAILADAVTAAGHSAVQLTDTINMIIPVLEQSTEDESVKSGRGIDVKEWIRQLLIEGEESKSDLTHRLAYLSVTIVDKKGQQRITLPRGMALLTNKRLLLVTKESQKQTSMDKTRQNLTHMDYSLNSSFSEVAVFYPIPLSCIRSVDIVSQCEGNISSTIKGYIPCLADCRSASVSHWEHESPVSSTKILRVIRFGILMPCWDEMNTVEIRLSSTYPLERAMKFISNAQKSVTSLRV